MISPTNMEADRRKTWQMLERILRKSEKNLTQDDLAERLHCTRHTISNYENGKSEPNIELLIEIASRSVRK